MRITRHAREQMTRRRVRREDVELAIGLGTEVHAANATFYILTMRDIPLALRRDPDARRAEGTTVVVSGETILTVYRNRDSRHLRQTRAA